jgi:hypothetical protein
MKPETLIIGLVKLFVAAMLLWALARHPCDTRDRLRARDLTNLFFHFVPT